MKGYAIKRFSEKFRPGMASVKMAIGRMNIQPQRHEARDRCEKGQEESK